MKFLRRGAKRTMTTSAAGDPVFRYERRAEAEVAVGDFELIEAIEAHIGEHLAEPSWVYHQVVSVYVHVDVHVVPPSDGRPFYTLVTSGMSQRPMRSRQEETAYAELVLSLPADWPMEDKTIDSRWPFRLLQRLAVFPHEYEAWLWTGSTVPNDDPPQPYAEGTGLCCAMLGPPRTVPEAFTVLQHGEREIHFHGVYTLLADEVQAKLDHGAGALQERFDQAGVTELVDPSRPSVFA